MSVAFSRLVPTVVVPVLTKRWRIDDVAGANALDPLDPVFSALERLGARTVRRGVPAHPGSLRSYDGIRIAGLRVCGTAAPIGRGRDERPGANSTRCGAAQEG